MVPVGGFAGQQEGYDAETEDGRESERVLHGATVRETYAALGRREELQSVHEYSKDAPQINGRLGVYVGN